MLFSAIILDLDIVINQKGVIFDEVCVATWIGGCEDSCDNHMGGSFNSYDVKSLYVFNNNDDEALKKCSKESSIKDILHQSQYKEYIFSNKRRGSQKWYSYLQRCFREYQWQRRGQLEQRKNNSLKLNLFNLCSMEMVGSWISSTRKRWQILLKTLMMTMFLHQRTSL